MNISFFELAQKSQHATLPIIVDIDTALMCMAEFSKQQFGTLEQYRESGIENLKIYEKEEEKKYLSIKEVRQWITDLGEKPYIGKTLSVLLDFDEATPEAMNASLKILEEPPSYALILLVVNNPESLLETIRSRTLNFFRNQSFLESNPEMEVLIDQFIEGNILPLVQNLYMRKLEEPEILSILIAFARKSPKEKQKYIEVAIEDLLKVHENPRNILDRVLLLF